MIVIKIKTRNDAFKPDAGPEVARILRDELVPFVEATDLVRGDYLQLHDVNGNIVGSMEVRAAE